MSAPAEQRFPGGKRREERQRLAWGFERGLPGCSQPPRSAGFCGRKRLPAAANWCVQSFSAGSRGAADGIRTQNNYIAWAGVGMTLGQSLFNAQVYFVLYKKKKPKSLGVAQHAEL